ncbi:MAG: DNA translocase FtsK 4TM domain-containing protein [Alphaproteobacteria bacterium]|nr:DNA translocase FtsK 4TM domain-containing protein [Alphaproteobacteria bacterium]
MNELEDKPPLMSDRLRLFLWRRLFEIAGVGIFLSGLVLAVILLSANSQDPSFNTASGQDVHNLLGPLGAELASFLYDSFGLVAGLISLILLIWGARITVQKHLKRWRLRLLGLLVSLFLLSAGAHGLLAPVEASADGGMTGRLIFEASMPLTSQIGWPGWLSPRAILASVFTILGLLIYIWSSAISYRQMASGLASLRHVRALLPALPKKAEADADSAPVSVQKPVKKKRNTPAARKEPVIMDNMLADETPEAVDAPLPAGKTATRRRQQTAFDFEGDGRFKLPPLKLLKTPPKASSGPDDDALGDNAARLKQVLEDFRIQGEIDEVRYGPVVTRYGLNPAPGTKSQRVIALADDIARYMSALAVRVAVVPGQNVIGIELPNDVREMVLLRHIFDHPEWLAQSGKLPLALGKDIAGAPIIADLAKMPHLLVAGTTGSGKSVGINGMILSLLYRYRPEECRLIMIDPKMLELSVYDGIPHLLTPVVTDPSKAVMALKWAVREMENRYRNMAKMGVRNIDGYNERLAEARDKGEMLTRRVQTGFDAETGKPVFEEEILDLAPLPYIVVIIDEVADLMMVAGKEIEAAVQRLAQMARAAGIHVIMATQRPSVDVITGTIKANFPTRISFQVTSRIDSRTILGEQGAEQLLGRGDMLYMEGGGRIVRVHGPFVDDHEVEEVANFLRQQGEPEYNESVTEEAEAADPAVAGENGAGASASGNSLYDQAVALVIREQKASTSFVQRHLKIGYNRAATLIEEMESAGIISAANHVGKRDVLISNDEM